MTKCKEKGPSWGAVSDPGCSGGDCVNHHAALYRFMSVKYILHSTEILRGWKPGQHLRLFVLLPELFCCAVISVVLNLTRLRFNHTLIA